MVKYIHQLNQELLLQRKRFRSTNRDKEKKEQVYYQMLQKKDKSNSLDESVNHENGTIILKVFYIHVQI